jgi:hypothetical protein
VWLYGEVIARRASTEGAHRKSGNRDFRCQAFGLIRICETPNPDKDKARVTSQRSHRPGLSLED